MFLCIGLFAIFPCTPAAASAPAAPYCDIARPIYWSASDTRGTKTQADRENRKWKRLCQAMAAPR